MNRIIYLLLLIILGCGSDKLTYDELKAERYELLFKLLQEKEKLQEKTTQLEEKINQLEETKAERDKLLQERDELQKRINQLDERIKLLEAPKGYIINTRPDELIPISSNGAFTITFDSPVEEVQAEEFTTDRSPDGLMWTLKGHNLDFWRQHPKYAKGYLPVLVTWKNKDGLSETKLLKLTVDDTSPKIISSSPQDGESGIEPEKVNKIIVEFDEPVNVQGVRLRVVGGNFIQIKSEVNNNKNLTVIFLGGAKLAKGTKYELTGRAKDRAGNENDFKITFETRK